ncbi:carcinine hydrolase/isopenicillin-N N-acyltransferase family protein [Rubinisphaera italica]|uniref:Acyl-coenzyme A:6-aminopenicillanic acid acyl-transferase n=1 Tax=Rubinisphaera italica TaxID=2527969 RepID=A0A5C5XF08_9PLAN|nr:carcinine hydrolase/isopenicillin-N N-acyltransferase family protein [Rubinisphaera italica]TWT60933.1 Acyl-coenzyme A:6-aminopenicillanic acid acyl-transferase [Rubinisphaera italica]
MSIIKNEPVYEFKDSDYTHPRHIIVSGTNEEIGHDLGNLAREEYGTKLCVYDDPVYAKARREYLSRNWPEMLEKSKGVLKAYGLDEDDVIFDGTTLPYDFYDSTRGVSLGANTCSAVVLPCEKTDTGATFASRNFDLMAMVLWSELIGKTPPEGAHNCWERGIVLETRPDQGYKTIQVGGHEVLSPWIDGINEEGLYVTAFHDPWGVGGETSPSGGMDVSGITMIQSFGYILSTCATVEEAKHLILRNHLTQVLINAHVLIADRQGNATAFEIDQKTQAYVFVDRKAGEPFFITNHPLHLFPTPDTFPEINMEAEHNSFTRQVLLNDAYARLKPPFKREDATSLTDAIHCAFIDDEKAEAGPKERTLINVNVDLSKPEIDIRWYLGDVGPVAGTNHIEDRMSNFYTFGF